MEETVQGYVVYIMSNDKRNLFYTSVTGFLLRKLQKHLEGEGYDTRSLAHQQCRELVYIEQFNEAHPALERSEKLQALPHQKIATLVAIKNPNFDSLNHHVLESGVSMR